MIYERVNLWILGFSVLIGPMLASVQIASAQPSLPSINISIRVKGVTGKLGLRNTIIVEVENLSKYLEQSGKDARTFVLYLDWRPLKGVNPRLIDSTDKVQFDVSRTSDSRDEWSALLGRPFAKDKGFTYLIPVSIGYENENPVLSDVTYPLTIINKTWFWIFVVFFASVLFFFVWLARASSIIRDPCPELPSTRRTYSLGRTQMAFWSFVVVVSYVFIWMVTGDLESLTESVLCLIGISTATALGAAYVGSSKHNAARGKLQSLDKEKAVLQARLKELGALIAASPPAASASDSKREKAEKNARLAQVNSEIQELDATMIPPAIRGFPDRHTH